MWDFEAGEILAFDKPLRWTSFDLVAKVRYNLCRKLGKKKLKVGHSGTLDPLATGVVIVCTGKKTKMIESLQYDVKEYIATLQLGATTPSYDQVEAFFGNGLLLVGVCLLVTALLLALSEWLQKKRQGEGHEVTYKDAIIIGIAQACAVLPGLSRSGSTIATGLLCGVKKESIAQFSFLMVLIPILGEAFLDMLKLLQGELTGDLGLVPAIVGFAAAFVTGCFACRFMIEIVRRQRLIWFALYCAVVGTVAIISTVC